MPQSLYTSDQASLLSEVERKALQERLVQGHQIAKNEFHLRLVIVMDMKGIDINTYSQGLATYWGIGDKRKNNGILLLLALKEKKARIEVGYGLEDRLPDAVAADIVDNIMLLAFKRANFFDGLEDATIKITNILLPQTLNPLNEPQEVVAKITKDSVIVVLDTAQAPIPEPSPPPPSVKKNYLGRVG